MSSDYISVIGTAYLEPIITLLKNFNSFPHNRVNPVQSSSTENGYSSSVILLSVIFLESMLGRVGYFDSNFKKRKFNALEYFKSIDKEEEYTSKLIEVFVIRDIIAHNHIWESTVDWNREGLYHATEPKKLDNYGDYKFNDVVDLKSRKTKELDINVFPTRIYYEDVRIVLKTIVDILKFIERLKGNVFGELMFVDNTGTVIRFYDYIEELVLD